MLKYLIAVCLAVLPVFAAPCVEASAVVYEALGATGCDVGLFTIKNVSWSSLSTDGYVAISPSDVMLRPLSSASGGVGLAFSSTKFDISGDQQINARLLYAIDPEPPPILDDFSLSMDTFTPVAPGFAIITAAVCAGDYFVNGCIQGARILPLLTVFHNGTDSDKKLTDFERFPWPTNVVDVDMSIILAARGASSSISGASAISETVPEPGAGLLAGLGLALLVGIRRVRNS